MSDDLDHLFAQTIWKGESQPIWPLLTFKLYRNLSGHPFTHKLQEDRRQELLHLLKEKLLKLDILDNPSFIDISTLSPTERLFLLEHYFTAENLMQKRSIQGGIIDQSLSFFIHLLSDEHMTLNYVCTDNYWTQAWKAITKIDEALQKDFSFAKSPRFGFLTSNPNNCGHALSVKAYLHLPALILTAQIDTALTKCVEKELKPLNLRGEEFLYIGDLVTLNNRFTLGVSENQLLHSLFASATRLMNAEKTLRAHIKGSDSTRIKDRVCRSFGLLMHTLTLDTPELLNHLSMLKLGADLGWISGVTDAQINNAFFNARRGHLLKEDPPECIDKQKIAKTRADQIQDLLAKVELNI